MQATRPIKPVIKVEIKVVGISGVSLHLFHIIELSFFGFPV